MCVSKGLLEREKVILEEVFPFSFVCIKLCQPLTPSKRLSIARETLTIAAMALWCQCWRQSREARRKTFLLSHGVD